MKKNFVLIEISLLLSGCTKTDIMDGHEIASPNNILVTDLTSYDESHTTSGNMYLGDYIRYSETEHEEAMMDYAMFKVGGYPLYAKSYDAGDTVSCFWGNGYEYVIENGDEPVYYWKWTDDETHQAVTAAIEDGRETYTQLHDKEETLLEQHKDDVYVDDWFRDGVRTVRAEFEYFPTDVEKSWKVDLFEDQMEKIKDIIKRAKTIPEIDPYQSDIRYSLSLYDSLGDYIFVVTMDFDRASMYVEKGGCDSDELTDMLNHIIQAMEESLDETLG